MAQRPKRVVPCDLDAEESLLGAVMLRSSSLEEVSRIVAPQDFYKPAHRLVYVAMLELWKSGATIDPVTVADNLRGRGLLERAGGAASLVSLIATTPNIGAAAKYAEIVVRMAIYRRVIEVAVDLTDAAYDRDGDPNDLIDQARSDLASMGVRLGDLPSDLWRLDDFLERPDADRPSDIIPGIIKELWRVMIVAGEGVGKTVLIRQIAILAAQGIHPFRFGPIDPTKTLIVDLENPDDSILDTCIPINERTKLYAQDHDRDMAWLWHRPSGINLRQRADRIAFETIIDQVRPKLVCLGPLYKAYEVSARENDELAAREVMSILDDLRTRYRFGLILEHHAPKESAGVKRKLMPYGSSLWLRWPEIGINLYPEDGNNMDSMTVGRWRGDRLENEWPEKIQRGGSWPWSGVWATGYIDRAGDEDRGVRREIPVVEPVDEFEPLDDLLPPDEDRPIDDYERF